MSNTTKTDKSPLFRVADHEQTPQAEFSHPLNPESAIRGISLSDATGLQRVGVHLIRIAPGKESFVYHKHHGEEEFIYILSG
ncbi:MAG: cupin, partial [Myxococcota bacterium]